jgi:hypothetical protein
MEQLEFLSQETPSAVVINRVIRNRKVPATVIDALRDNALTLEGKVWSDGVGHGTGCWTAAGRLSTLSASGKSISPASSANRVEREFEGLLEASLFHRIRHLLRYPYSAVPAGSRRPPMNHHVPGSLQPGRFG